jgi:adenylate kinase
VLDGFPRTVDQAEAAYKVARGLGVAVQVAAHLDVPRGALVRRLLARSRGADDTPDVIAHRLDVYEEKTLSMLDYYAERERLVVVDGVSIRRRGHCLADHAAAQGSGVVGSLIQFLPPEGSSP